jgi:antitoxin component of MazEF toxin-antitoxin module
MSRYTTKGVKRVLKKGGSLIVTIPPEVAKTLGLSAGEDLAFIRGENGVYMERQQKLVDDYCLLMRQKNEKS